MIRNTVKIKIKKVFLEVWGVKAYTNKQIDFIGISGDMKLIGALYNEFGYFFNFYEFKNDMPQPHTIQSLIEYFEKHDMSDKPFKKVKI